MENVQPTKLRKYTLEYAVLALACAVVYLFFEINGLQAYIRNDLANQKQEAIKAIYQNSLLIENLIKTNKNANGN